jgi:hypothetical protein
MTTYNITFNWNYDISQNWMKGVDPNFYFQIWNSSNIFVHELANVIIMDSNYPSGPSGKRLYQWTFTTGTPGDYYYQTYVALTFNGNVFSELTDTSGTFIVKKLEPTSPNCTGPYPWSYLSRPGKTTAYPSTISLCAPGNTSEPSDTSKSHGIKYDPLDNRRWSSNCYKDSGNNNLVTCYTPPSSDTHTDWCTYVSPKNIEYSVIRGRPQYCDDYGRGYVSNSATYSFEDCLNKSDNNKDYDGFSWSNENQCNMYSTTISARQNPTPGHMGIGPFGMKYGTGAANNGYEDMVSYIKLSKVPK